MHRRHHKLLSNGNMRFATKSFWKLHDMSFEALRGGAFYQNFYSTKHFYETTRNIFVSNRHLIFNNLHFDAFTNSFTIKFVFSFSNCNTILLKAFRKLLMDFAVISPIWLIYNENFKPFHNWSKWAKNFHRLKCKMCLSL